MPNVGQEGNIPNWNQAAAGPFELGNAGGYDAIEIPSNEVGDYIIEFNLPSGISWLNLHLFDVTVANASNQTMSGRLHSQGWQFSTESFTNPFNGVVYPYDGGNALYSVDFNGMQPWIFVVNFNSKGTADTGDFLEDRKSKIGNSTYGEFEVFLNPPDEELYPVLEREIDLIGKVEELDCTNSTYCIEFTTNSSGVMEGFLDFNNNGVYDEDNGEIYFGKEISKAGASCVPWDGKDAFGNRVTDTEFEIYASLSFGVTHLPLYDVEHQKNGFIINVVRPSTALQPKVFWDDRNIEDGEALDGKKNINGCQSGVDGCHRWRDRGAIADNNLSKQETINTWWYASVITESMVVNIGESHEVNLSFNGNDLVQDDTTVCVGDMLDFYVHNNQQHFDNSQYSYEWYFNEQLLTKDVRKQTQQILSVSEVVVVATDLAFPSCISEDTLKISVVNPVKIDAVVEDLGCGVTAGSIVVDLLDGPPNTAFFWKEFPVEKTNEISNLPVGTYNLLVVDEDYPHCGADSVFTIVEQEGIAIDRIDIDSAKCGALDGSGEVFMEDESKSYEYSWNGLAYDLNKSIENLGAGKYKVKVREQDTECTDTVSFQIISVPYEFAIDITDEQCNNGEGSVLVVVEGEGYGLNWDGKPSASMFFQNLSEDIFEIEIFSKTDPTCESVITEAKVMNIGESHEMKLSFDPNDLVQGDTTVCVGDMVGFYVYNKGDHFDKGLYTYEWFINELSLTNDLRQQSEQIFEASEVVVIAKDREHPVCVSEDTLKVFVVNPVKIDAVVEEPDCGAKNGSVSVKLLDGPPNTEYFWQEFSMEKTGDLNNLTVGAYNLVVEDKLFPHCGVDTVFSLEEVGGIDIEKVEVSSTPCGKLDGYGEVFMDDPSKKYEYSWDGSLYGKNTSLEGLSAGLHNVQVREEGTLCTDEVPFKIVSVPYDVSVVTSNEYCSNGQGSILVDVEGEDYMISWNGKPSKETLLQNLSKGTYTIEVVSESDPSCSFNTAVVLIDSNYTLQANFDYERLQGVEDEESEVTLQFTNLSSEVENYIWMFGDGSTTTLVEPEHTFELGNDYEINLTVVDSNGCYADHLSTISNHELKAQKCGIALPNVFSPNEDMMNDDIGVLG